MHHGPGSMTEKDYSPLTMVCVRALNDKLYEKRKTGALEVEKLVRDFQQQNNNAQIERLLTLLGQDFTLSHNPNGRKGGLIGLAATAIALGKDASSYVESLVKPVLACFADPDSRVRYYACEALYNVVKVTRACVLQFFGEIFDGLSNLAADPDQNVKNGSELLDRLMKDVVTESADFNITEFVPLLRERIYTKNACARQFLVSWVSVLDSVPENDMLRYLPEFLDGLFCILSDPSMEIRRMCEACLGDFLLGIIKYPEKANFAEMINILIAHCQSTDELLQLTSITWIKELVVLAGRKLLPFAPGMLTAILPCIAIEGDADGKKITDIRKSIYVCGRSVNNNLIRLVTTADDTPPSDLSQETDLSQARSKGHSPTKDRPREQPAKERSKDQSQAKDRVKDQLQLKERSKDQLQLKDRSKDHSEVNGRARPDSKDEARLKEEGNVELERSERTKDEEPVEKADLDVEGMVMVLTQHLSHVSVQARLAVLRWIYQLLVNIPNITFRYMDELFPVMLNTLSDSSDEVVLLVLEVFAEISSSPAGRVRESMVREVGGGSKPATPKTMQLNPYFTQFVNSLLKLFCKDRQLLDDRGAFIIRQLCMQLNADDMYRAVSEILSENGRDDPKFAYQLVQTLNTILLTSTELFHMRNKLKEMDSEETCSLFNCLYKSWCYNPVATISLCLLTQNYQHACQLLHIFGDLEVTVEFLTEVDKLVQLIESPVFTFLRLQLLNVDHNQHLVKSLYGLLMLLPQSDAFRTLHYRLQCVPMQNMALEQRNSEKFSESRKFVKKIDFRELLQHFRNVQKMKSRVGARKGKLEN